MCILYQALASNFNLNIVFLCSCMIKNNTIVLIILRKKEKYVVYID